MAILTPRTSVVGDSRTHPGEIGIIEPFKFGNKFRDEKAIVNAPAQLQGMNGIGKSEFFPEFRVCFRSFWPPLYFADLRVACSYADPCNCRTQRAISHLQTSLLRNSWIGIVLSQKTLQILQCQPNDGCRFFLPCLSKVIKPTHSTKYLNVINPISRNAIKTMELQFWIRSGITLRFATHLTFPMINSSMWFLFNFCHLPSTAKKTYAKLL